MRRSWTRRCKRCGTPRMRSSSRIGRAGTCRAAQSGAFERVPTACGSGEGCLRLASATAECAGTDEAVKGSAMACVRVRVLSALSSRDSAEICCDMLHWPVLRRSARFCGSCESVEIDTDDIAGLRSDLTAFQRVRDATCNRHRARCKKERCNRHGVRCKKKGATDTVCNATCNRHSGCCACLCRTLSHAILHVSGTV